ncbi:hypothetical protein DM02DRAFT_212291, partial [Periconia macrospinosa]
AHSNIILFDGKTHEQTYTEDGRNSYSAKISITPESLPYILFTSGSTGRPKGFLVPHSAICTSILAFSPIVKLSQDSRVLHSLHLALMQALERSLLHLARVVASACQRRRLTCECLEFHE